MVEQRRSRSRSTVAAGDTADNSTKRTLASMTRSSWRAASSRMRSGRAWRRALRELPRAARSTRWWSPARRRAMGALAPKPVLCRAPADVLQGRRVKPSLCPSLEVLDEVAAATRSADAPLRRRLRRAALRALGGASPEAALGLEKDGLLVMGTHRADNSPMPEAAGSSSPAARRGRGARGGRARVRVHGRLPRARAAARRRRGRRRRRNGAAGRRASSFPPT